jgi:DNA-binding transcriptional MocR family regulator
MDRPGYVGAIQSFRAAGAKLIGWDHRARPTATSSRTCSSLSPEADYTNPDVQQSRRDDSADPRAREVLSLAQRYRVPIVEDATYRDLYFTEAPPPSLRELDDHNIVIYLNSFSKVMAPGCASGGSRPRRRSSTRSRSSSSGWIRTRPTWCNSRSRG